MKLIKINWYGLKHDEVIKRFEGDLKYVGTMPIVKILGTAAVYHARKPNREKGHKDYMLLFARGDKMYVAGLTKEEMEKERKHQGVYCFNCDEVIYSVHHHDFHKCACGRISVDGGKEYLKVSYRNISDYREVRLDLLTDRVYIKEGRRWKRVKEINTIERS